MIATLDIRRPLTAATAREGYELALDSCSPVFVPATYFTDDRGFSLMNQLQGVMSDRGQVNFSTQHPGVIKAWHRHQKQTDFWMCLNGHLKVGVYDEEETSGWMLVIGERNPGTIIIPPPLWHGAATVGAQPAGLLYYVTRAYDPNDPDEERRAHDSVDGFPWETLHG